MDYDALEKRLREPPFGTETSERNLMMAAADAIADLRARNDALCNAVEIAQSFGCPVCNGDCGSANIPMLVCPMQEYRDALAANREG